MADQKDKTAILIDPAWEAKKIDEQLKNSESILKAILLTHHQLDHIHLAEYFAKRYNVPVMMSATEINYYSFSCKNLTAISNNNELLIGNIKEDFIAFRM